MSNEPAALPKHIAVIMDGNGRWAKKHGLPRKMGHRQGAQTFSDLAQYCRKLGIQYLTAYTFSTENWKRPPEEVEAIMSLLEEYLDKALQQREENVSTRFIGERTNLSRRLIAKMEQIEEGSRQNDGITVNIALNYGGRSEMVHAAQKLALLVKDQLIAPEDINESLLESCLYTAGQPDPDLIIRPSGEMRTSNFLLWQSAYAELIFMDVLWPDFKPQHLDRAIAEYQRRNRRFGGL